MELTLSRYAIHSFRPYVLNIQTSCSWPICWLRLVMSWNTKWTIPEYVCNINFNRKGDYGILLHKKIVKYLANCTLSTPYSNYIITEHICDKRSLNYQQSGQKCWCHCNYRFKSLYLEHWPFIRAIVKPCSF